MAYASRRAQARRLKVERLNLLSLILAALCFIGANCLVAGSARADLWWDTNGATAGSSSGSAPEGNFTDANWTTDPAGTSATQSWVPGETAVFAAGTNATYALYDGYEVDVLTPSIEASGIKVEEGMPYLRASDKTLIFTGGALAVDAAADSTLHIQMLFGPTNGVITKTGPGQMITTQDQTTFAGKWVVNDGIVGVLSIFNDRAIGAIPAAVVPDQFTLNNGGRIYGVGGTKRGITLGPGGGGFGNNGSGTSIASWAGPITGTSGGPLIVDGNIDAYLYNTANNYDGETIIKRGTLHVAAAGVIPASSKVTIMNNGSLFLDGFNETVKTISSTAGSISLGGTLTIQNPSGETLGSNTCCGGKVVKNGTGTITLAGSNAYSEFILISGTIGVGSNSAFGNKLTINGGTLSNTATSVRSFTSSVIGAQSINADFSVDDSLNATPGQIQFHGHPRMNASHTITVDGNASLMLDDLNQAVAGVGLTKAGSGTLELRGLNSSSHLSGPITVLAGRLQVDANSVIGNGNSTIYLAGGTLNTTGYRDYINGPLANPINVTADSAITTTSTLSIVEVNFTGSSFTGSGKVTFRNDAPSGTGVFRPKIYATNAGFAPGPIEIANGPFGTTVLYSINGFSSSQTFNHVVSGTGSLYIAGTNSPPTFIGATVLNAANTYSGGTTVSSGKLFVNNTSGSGSGSGPVSVSAGATLGGTG